MKKNVGQTDKTIRLILGLVIAIVGIYYQSWWGLLSLIPIITGYINFCGLYAIFGISTCKNK